MVTAADRLWSFYDNFKQAQYHCSDALCLFKTIPLFRCFVHTPGPPLVPPPIVYLSPKPGPQKRILHHHIHQHPTQSITQKPEPQKLTKLTQTKKTPQTPASMCKETYYTYYCGHTAARPDTDPCDRWYNDKTCKTKKKYVRYKTCCDTYGCRNCAGCTRCREWSR
jgi:hypothetical protein